MNLPGSIILRKGKNKSHNTYISTLILNSLIQDVMNLVKYIMLF